MSEAAVVKRTTLPFWCLLIGLVSLPLFMTLFVPMGAIWMGVASIRRVQEQGGSVRANIITMTGMSLAGAALLYGIVAWASGYDFVSVWAQVELVTDGGRKRDLATADDFLVSLFQKKFEAAYTMLDKTARARTTLEQFRAEHESYFAAHGIPRRFPLYDFVEEEAGARRIIFNMKYRGGGRKVAIGVRNGKIESSTLAHESETP